MRTRIEIYNSVNAMKRGIRRMERKGWFVLETETVDPGWRCLKTAILGCLFFPLALLGKKPMQHKVTYQKQE